MDQKRIAAVVINSVNHDARVLKEADSLARAGFKVRIFGIRDNRCDDPRTVRDTGVLIERCEWKYKSHVLVAKFFLYLGVLAAAIALTFVAVFFDTIALMLTSPASAVLLFGAVVVLALLMPFLYQYRKHHIIASRLRPEPHETGHAATDALFVPLKPHVWLTKLKNRIFQHVREKQIIELMKRFDPHAVHCHDLNTMPIGHAYARRHPSCKVVFDSHELYEEQSLATPLQKRIYQGRQQYYSSRVDAFITINQSIADYLKKKYPKLPDPVLVRNATKPLTEPVIYDGRLHSKAGLPHERRILLYQGGFAARRGLDALVRSCVLLPADWCLVMMGWGAFEPKLRQIAEEIDPEERSIRFIPPAPHAELVHWTCGGSLGVIPYENVCLNHWFCSPNKLWEYPIAGVPILASPFPEMRATIEKWDIGLFLRDPATPEGIAEVVEGLTDERLAAMKRNCREYIRNDNWTVYEARLVGLYGELLGPPPAKSPNMPLVEVKRDGMTRTPDPVGSTSIG